MASPDTVDATTPSATPGDLSPAAPAADPTVDIMARLDALESNATMYRQGQITALSPLSVTLGAGDTAYASVKCIDGASLAVNDVVAVLTFQHDLIILGRIGSGAGSGLVGEIRAIAFTTVPTGYLACDGASYLRTDYPALFAKIGTTWGSADGTHFNVPNFTGRMLLGAGTPSSGNGATNHALGATGGEETHVLTATELAAHTHTVNDPGHNHGLTANNNSGGLGLFLSSTGAAAGVTTGNRVTGIGINANTPANTAHNNLPPFGVVKWIIKT